MIDGQPEHRFVYDQSVRVVASATSRRWGQPDILSHQYNQRPYITVLDMFLPCALRNAARVSPGPVCSFSLFFYIT